MIGETQNFAEFLSSQVTFISAVMSIGAVCVSSIISAAITQRGIKKVKEKELIFYEMVSAYNDFLKACNSFSDSNNAAEIFRVTEASLRARLFASPQTCEYIEKYGNHIVSRVNQLKAGGYDLNEIKKEAQILEENLLLQMQKDLKK